MDLVIRIAGEAGQGLVTIGNLLLGALNGTGLHVLSSKSYMSRIRGGLNWFDVRISDAELHGPRENADILVALTDDALAILKDDLNEGGLALYNGDEADGAVAIDFVQAAKDTAGNKIMANAVAAGCVYAVLGYDCDELCEYLRKTFEPKGQEIVDGNVRCAKKGFELAGEHAGSVQAPQPGGSPGYITSGAEAIGLSAARSGVKVVTAYPMTPGTATFQYLAGAAETYNIVVEQAEDEIAAVNMMCGAAYAGAPALVSTSGGGFALMAEGVSLAGIMELPIVIVIAQRPGPATGLPTRTGQEDLLFALRAGHGEFPRAVYAPGSIHQCYDLTRRALQQAHKHQTPVILLTDQYLQDREKNIEPLDEGYDPIDRCLVEDPGDDYRRYALVDGGVSPRAAPGRGGFVVCDSDEHDEAGHIAEDLTVHLAQHEKRLGKLDGLVADAVGPDRYGPDDAETLLVCWGSTLGPALEAIDALNADEGPAFALVHFRQVWPLNPEAVEAALGRPKRTWIIEGNATGQLAALLRQEGYCRDARLLPRYDGMPLTVSYIVRSLREAD